jgi:Domain of unknown function (DUF4258)
MKREDFLERLLAVIRERVERGAYIISFTHTERLRERRIGAEDVEDAIRNGVIIEDYPDDPRTELPHSRPVRWPDPSCAVASTRSRS